MDPSIPFSKAEMAEQLSTALLLFIRSTSWALDSGAARRLIGWPDAAGHDALRNPSYEDFYEVAKEEGQSLDLSKFSTYRIFSDLYDYGVLGVLQSTIFPIESATEATFAMGFVFDCFHSQLLFEMQGGSSPALGRCMHVARMSVARQVLGGGERCLVPASDDAPEGLLTIPEVALLANMEEGSVRNAASGKKNADSLRTVVRDGKRFVTPESALTWLRRRRGFRETQVRGNLVELDLRNRAFLGAWEVADFLRQRADAMGIAPAELAERIGLPPSADSIDFRFRKLDDLCDAAASQRLAELLKIEPRLLALRLEECRAEERVAELRRAIERVRLATES